MEAENKDNHFSIEGVPPDLFAPPSGCAFAVRCDYAINLCVEKEPPMIDLENGHCSKCWLNLKDMPGRMRPNWMTSERLDVDVKRKE